MLQTQNTYTGPAWYRARKPTMKRQLASVAPEEEEKGSTNQSGLYKSYMSVDYLRKRMKDKWHLRKDHRSVFSNSGSNTSSSYSSYSSYSSSTEEEHSASDVFATNQQPKAVNLLRKKSTKKMDAIAQAMQRQTHSNPSRKES